MSLIAMSAVAGSTHAARANDLRFLALGDSYTIGEGVAPADSWPMQLTLRLRSHARELAAKLIKPEIVARTGWTAAELRAAIERHTFAPPYALVTLLIGVNDQYRQLSSADYRVQFTNLLQRAIELADGKTQRVVVVSIPDWGVTPFARDSVRDVAAISREIDLYNAANAEISEKMRVAYIDVTGISRAAESRGLLVSDGLHPSAAQYALWAQAILPVALRALQGQ